MNNHNQSTQEGSPNELKKFSKKDESQPGPSTPRVEVSDALDSEFHYLSSLIRFVAPALTKPSDRNGVQIWLKKLYRPEYHTERFREKRNKYLVFLAITLMNDELSGIFADPPPEYALPDLDHITIGKEPSAHWEREIMWEDALRDPETQLVQCSIHQGRRCPKVGVEFGDALDRQFLLLLYIARPYAALLRVLPERMRAAAWLKQLCSITKASCIILKGIRNDYMMSLMGYLYHQQLAGPFVDYPNTGILPSLAEASKYAADRNNFIDPFSAETSMFLESMPQIQGDGAFAFVAITGEVLTDMFETE